MKEFIYFAPVVGVLVAFSICIWGFTGWFSRDAKERERGFEIAAIGAVVGIVSAMLL